ncbi:MAG: DUF3135 domain-containing protein [Woeseiaceae bacterium]
MPSNSINKIDFAHWVNLASSDPKKFEQLRQDNISALIDSTSSRHKHRLQGLQWQIDQVRKQHKNSSIGACLAISELMWETLDKLSGRLKFQAKPNLAPPIPVKNAEIIAFHAQTQS